MKTNPVVDWLLANTTQIRIQHIELVSVVPRLEIYWMTRCMDCGDWNSSGVIVLGMN